MTLPPPGEACPRGAGGTSPRTALASASAPHGHRETGTTAASGHESHRGMRAMQIVAPRSMSAWADAALNDSPVRRSTRSTFTSTGSTSSPNAKQRIAAAVYGPTPGSSVRSSGQPVGRHALRGAVEVQRAPVVAEPLPLPDHVGGSRRRERVDGRPALQPGLVARKTRSTCVCWSMTSETRIAYGSRVRRQGRSRPCSANHCEQKTFHVGYLREVPANGRARDARRHLVATGEAPEGDAVPGSLEDRARCSRASASTGARRRRFRAR